MVVGMPRTEAEKEAQHVEGGVCLEVIQNEEKLLPGRVEMAFWPARWNLLDFALPTPFQLDGIVGRREGRIATQLIGLIAEHCRAKNPT